MDVIQAIMTRQSIRGFKSTPISKEILTSVLEAACRAPSAMNTQPWEFVVLAGSPLDKLKQGMIEKLRKGEPMEPEHHVTGWSKDSVFRNRQVDLAKSIFKLMGIQREDAEKRTLWMERGFRFFDAPAAIILLHDRDLTDSGPLLDLGAAMQNICLAAHSLGLGTCIEDQGILYPELLREIASIPENKRIIIGIAIGYADEEFPANKLVSEREPVENLTTWLGF